MYIDKKNFLMCGSCFWCVSCLTGNRTIVPCPSCGNNEMQSTRISDYESYKLDHDYINEMVSQLRTNQGSGSPVNIAHTEEDCDMVAKTCGCKNTKRKVTYSFVDSYHSLCKDKKDIMLSEVQACEILLKYPRDENDTITVENEIAELKLALDLLH